MKEQFKLGTENLEFEMTNKTYMNLDDMYGNAGAIVNSIYFGTLVYKNKEDKPESFGKDGFVNNSIKLMSESCVSRSLSVEELEDKLSSTQMVQEVGPFATKLYLNYMGVKKGTTTSKTKKK